MHLLSDINQFKNLFINISCIFFIILAEAGTQADFGAGSGAFGTGESYAAYDQQAVKNQQQSSFASYMAENKTFTQTMDGYNTMGGSYQMQDAFGAGGIVTKLCYTLA